MTDNVSAITRRTFVQTSTAAATAMMFPSGVYAQGSDLIKVGVVGTGGRGTGAISNVLMSAEGVEITRRGSEPGSPRAVARHARQGSRRQRCLRGDKAGFKVAGNRVYTGFDAYKQVLAADVNYVILATPPGFRPQHLAAAVAAGKHIFTEKPVGTDSAGIRSVLATYEARRRRSSRSWPARSAATRPST